MSNDPKKFKTGIAVTGTASVGGDTITTNNASQVLQNKSIDADTNTITNIDNADIKVGAAIDAAKIHDGSVSNTEFGYLNGVTSAIQSQLDAKVDDSEKGAPNGVATLDGAGRVPVSQLPSAVMTYEGVWNASTNSPTLADGVGDAGQVYRVGTAGTQNLGSGNISFQVGDYVIYNGTTWEKSDTTDAVASVNGLTGIVVLDTDDINEGATNLYHTDERAQDAVGTILVDSAKIDLTYNDATPSITATIVANSIDNSDISPTAAIDATKIADGSVTNAEFQYLGGVTSDLQTQLNNKASTALDNLVGPTAINVNLLPDAPDNRDLGTTTNYWAYTNTYAANAFFFDVKEVQDGNLNGDSAGRFVAVQADSDVVIRATKTNYNVKLEPNGTGHIDASSKQIKEVADPTSAQDAATKAYVDAAVAGGGSPGDIAETSFSLANNQAAPANVTGLAFANATVRSFKVLASVQIDATADSFEVFELLGVQRGADWSMSISSTGDDSQVAFSITNAGQIQYTSANYAGFVSGAIRFRAWVTSV